MNGSWDWYFGRTTRRERHELTPEQKEIVLRRVEEAKRRVRQKLRDRDGR